MPRPFSAFVPKRFLILTFATAMLTAAIMSVATAASAQDRSGEDSQSQVAFVSSLLSAEDLSYLFPLGSQQRREFLEVELSLLIKTHGLVLTAKEESGIIASWLAMLATHESRAEYAPASEESRSWSGDSNRSGSSDWSPSGGGTRPSTDTGYKNCSSSYIDSIGVSFSGTGGYDTIHLEPSDSGKRWASGHQMYTAMLRCLRGELHMNPHVKSWNSIYDQLVCHMAGYFLGAGTTWDLEGHRSAKPLWWWRVWAHKCNW